MFDLPTEDDAALRRAVIISWDALATHLSICGRSDQVPGVIMAKQRSTACIPACVDTMDVFFLPHAFGIVPEVVEYFKLTRPPEINQDLTTFV